MSGETLLTVIGNLTAPPELRYTPDATAVVNFTVASTPRVFDRASGEWKDGETLFLRCNLWRQAAEHAAESLTQGSRVIVRGRLIQRSYETREGDKRTVVELAVDELGASLRYATAKITRSGKTTSPATARRDDSWSAGTGFAPTDPSEESNTDAAAGDKGVRVDAGDPAL
ncbi:single-stranded DNA-binding protein [Nocardia puris]|uniref:single-stranded DNA-binding protein n=1 Tax=Nocardia puris TaxID=208602 RepID=UPI002E1D6731